VVKIRKLDEASEQSSAGRRRTYAAPRLVEFGPVGRLTQSGLSGDPENMPPMGSGKKFG
jgi:hypothetical protein